MYICYLQVAEDIICGGIFPLTTLETKIVVLTMTRALAEYA